MVAHGSHKPSAYTPKVIKKAPARLRLVGGAGTRHGSSAAPATSRARLLRKLGLAPRGDGRAASHALVIRAPPRRHAPAPWAPARAAAPMGLPQQVQLHGRLGSRVEPGQPGVGAATGSGASPGAGFVGAAAKRKAPELLGASGLEAAARCARRAPRGPGPGPPKGPPCTPPAKGLVGGKHDATGKMHAPTASKDPLTSPSGQGSLRSITDTAPSSVAGSLFYSSPGAVGPAAKVIKASKLQGGNGEALLSKRRPEHRTAVLATLVPDDIQW